MVLTQLPSAAELSKKKKIVSMGFEYPLSLDKNTVVLVFRFFLECFLMLSPRNFRSSRWCISGLCIFCDRSNNRSSKSFRQQNLHKTRKYWALKTDTTFPPCCVLLVWCVKCKMFFRKLCHNPHTPGQWTVTSSKLHVPSLEAKCLSVFHRKRNLLHIRLYCSVNDIFTLLQCYPPYIGS
jgi:hypothetical protein